MEAAARAALPGVERGRAGVSGTSHFAWSLDHRLAYFHQSLLEREHDGSPVRAADLSLVELDVATGGERVWRLRPPPDDRAMETANFHSGFFFEEGGCRYVGLLRTGALLESLEPHSAPLDHAVFPAPASTIWIVPLDPQATELQAELLPGVEDSTAWRSHTSTSTRRVATASCCTRTSRRPTSPRKPTASTSTASGPKPSPSTTPG